MRTALKMVLPLIVSVAVVSGLFAWYQVRTERRILRSDLSRRAEILGETLQESVEPLMDHAPDKNLQRLVERFGEREHLKGVAVYDAAGKALAITPGIAKEFQSWPEVVKNAAAKDQEQAEFVREKRADQAGKEEDLALHILACPLHRDNRAGGSARAVPRHELHRRAGRAYASGFAGECLGADPADHGFGAGTRAMDIHAAAEAHGALAAHAEDGRRKRRQGLLPELPQGQGEIFDQLHQEVTHLAHDLNTARATAEEEARLRDTGASLWTAERLRVSLQDKLHGTPLFVVSNREPYMHVMNEKDKTISVIVPASGLVTALEPVLLACNGTWVASGPGSADREVVDANDRLRVPPDHPSYTLRRVWMTDEEDKGFYEGFSNEGLWPLCHIAHTRPVFRPEDWLHYQRINRRFADVVLQEMEGTESPILLAQDYHFALLPRMVKDARPDARVAIFWHIPWPNAEVFGICPWQRELVDGLLGADLIGFHIQTHCNNFLETVDHALEALTEWDRFAVNRQGHVTRVRPYPISVAFPENLAERSGNAQRGSGANVDLRGAGHRGFVPWRGSGSCGLHEGNSGEVPGNRAIPRAVSILPAEIFPDPNRGAEPDRYRAVQEFPGRSDRGGGTDQREVSRRTVEADCLPEKTPFARRDHALLPGRIGVPGDFAA